MKGDLIRLSYVNSNDFGNVIFSDTIMQDLYLYGTLGSTKIEFIEYGNKNENNEFSATKKIMEESLTFSTIGGEWVYKLLCFISMCDTILISNKVGELYQIIEMKIESDPQNISSIRCKFILNRIVWELCNNNPLTILTCPVSTQNIISLLNDNDAIYTNKTAVLNTYYALLNNSDLSLHNPINNKVYIIKRVDTIDGWEFIQPSINSRYLNENNNLFYVLKQNEIADGNFYPVTILPTLNTITNNLNGTLTLTGECLDGYYVKVYQSNDNNIFSAIGTQLQSSLFNANGITITPTTGYIYFRLGLLDSNGNICCYGNSTEIVDGIFKCLVIDSSSGLPIKNASVKIKNVGGTILETLTTPVNGIVYSSIYIFGNYKYDCSCAGYITATNIAISNDTPIEIITIQIVLTP